MKWNFQKRKAGSGLCVEKTSWVILLALPFLFMLSVYQSFGATKTSAGTGNWSSAATWSPSGVPANGDDVIIAGGHTITVDGNYTCNNLDLGNNTSSNSTLQISTSGKSLTVNGDFRMNPSSKNKTFVLDAGPGTINMAGTFSFWSITGTHNIKVGSGTINFTPAVTISDAGQNIVFNGAGTVTFNGAFTDQKNNLATYSGCTVNFNSSYTANTTNANWGGNGTAVFGNGCSITPTTNITFNNIQTAALASATLNSGAGTVVVAGSVTLASGSTFTTNMNFEVDGDWTNNGGTLSGGTTTITLNSAAPTISGSASTAFPTLQIGKTGGTTAVSCAMNNSNTSNYISFTGNGYAKTLTLNSGCTLTVNNDVTINQPTAALTNSLSVNAGSCTISGNLIFSGSNNTTTRIAQVAVTSGTFTLNGNVTWMSNTAVATEVITVSTGAITFGSSLTMGANTGTLSVTSTGAINFNGSSAPSFSFGGSATAPVFTTTSGCSINFAAGFTNNTNALTIAAGSTTHFTNTGTITANANITFGNVQTDASQSATLASAAGTVTAAGSFVLALNSSVTTNKNFEVDGDWTNNGGTFSGSAYTVTLNGSSNIIGGTSSTTFGTVQIGTTSGLTSASYTVNNSNTFSYLNISASSYSRTLTIGSGNTVTVNNDLTINQPTAANITSSVAVNAGTCNVTGNLIFAGTASATSQVASVNVTSGTFALTGNIAWMSNTAVATEVITVSTGAVTFNSSVTMGSGSGTVGVTSTGTINFNGGTSPSLNFGGATGPVFTTTSGCTVNFAKGFANTTTALTFVSGASINVGSLTSLYNLAIDPGTTITNNGTTIVYGDLTASSAATFVNGANATLEIRGAISSNVTLTATATGNTVTYAGSGAQTIKATAYYNLAAGNSGAKTLGSGITINNNLTVQGAATLATTAAQTVAETFTYASSGSSTLSNNLSAKGAVISSGTLNDGGNTITISGGTGWTNNGGTFSATGTVAFTGSTAANIGGSSATTFNNMTMNNSGGVTLNVSPAATTVITGALTLTNGVITTTSSNLLKLSSSATAGSGSASSYINGPMTKAGKDDFTFPVGKSGRWMRVGVSSLTSAATEITAEYFAAPYSDTTSKSADITQVSRVEYWDVNRTVTTDPVKLKFYWEDMTLSDIADCNYLTVAHYHDGVWQNEPARFTGGYCTGHSSGSVLMDGTVTTFSPFSFGGTGGSALPVKLVSFSARANNDKVETHWQTALEINNAYFAVERSADGIRFSEVARIDGAGNSTAMISYSYTDEDPLRGVSYYRLRQTDDDGAETYSEIAAVEIKSVHPFRFYPNPAHDMLQVETGNIAEESVIHIYDVTGKEFYRRSISADEAISNHTVAIPLSEVLPAGLYFVNKTPGDGSAEKLVVE